MRPCKKTVTQLIHSGRVGTKGSNLQPARALDSGIWCERILERLAVTSHLTYSLDTLTDDLVLRRGSAASVHRQHFIDAATWFDPPVHAKPSGPAGGSLAICVVQQGPITIVAVDGSIDLETAPQLSSALAPLVNGTPRRIIVDLTGATFLACVGMTVLLDAHAATEPPGMFAVVARGPHTAGPMRLLGLHRTMRIHPHLLTATIAMTRAG